MPAPASCARLFRLPRQLPLAKNCHSPAWCRVIAWRERGTRSHRRFLFQLLLIALGAYGLVGLTRSPTNGRDLPRGSGAAARARPLHRGTWDAQPRVKQEVSPANDGIVIALFLYYLGMCDTAARVQMVRNNRSDLIGSVGQHICMS